MTRTVALSLVLLFTGCSSSDDPPAERGTREHTVDAEMRIEVASVDDATAAIRATTESEGGYVGASTALATRAHLELRVPADRLGAVHDAIADLGHLGYASETAQDVTLAHADLEARLTSARAEETRLAAMFNDRTTDLADVLAVEHELTRVRSEIEQRDAEARALRDAISMAHLSVDVTSASPAFTHDPIAFVARAARFGLDATASMALFAAGVAIALAPSVLTIWAMFLLARRAVRLYRRRAIA
jgi:hypothetical protein